MSISDDLHLIRTILMSAGIGADDGDVARFLEACRVISDDPARQRQALGMMDVLELRDAVARLVYDQADPEPGHEFRHEFGGNGYSEAIYSKYWCSCGIQFANWAQSPEDLARGYPGTGSMPEPADMLVAWDRHIRQAAVTDGEQGGQP